MDLLIPKELADAIHAYLMERPVREVEAFVVAIRQLEQAPNGDEPTVEAEE